jgi:hypothetical protein
MNISEMTYGVEFETTIPAGAIEVGGYHNGRQIPGFPQGWTAQRDGSIDPTITGHVGAEIVSPILTGAEGLLQIREVVLKLNAMGARINTSCGFHVHVGFPSAHLNKLGHLVYIHANLEGALYAMTGTKNRERNTFCRSVKNPANPDAHMKDLNYEAVAAGGGIAALTRSYTMAGVGTLHRPAPPVRYHTLNITNLIGGNKPTVEFRVFQGTLNLHKVIAYVRVCLGIVQKACETRGRRPAWDIAGRGGQGGAGGVPLTGKEQVSRLFYRLGWNAGSTAKVYGFLEAPGIGGLDESKAIIVKMASKYDERP